MAYASRALAASSKASAARSQSVGSVVNFSRNASAAAPFQWLESSPFMPRPTRSNAALKSRRFFTLALILLVLP